MIFFQGHSQCTLWNSLWDNWENRKAENNSSHASTRATAEYKNIFIHESEKRRNSTMQVLPQDKLGSYHSHFYIRLKETVQQPVTLQ